MDDQSTKAELLEQQSDEAELKKLIDATVVAGDTAIVYF